VQRGSLEDYGTFGGFRLAIVQGSDVGSAGSIAQAVVAVTRAYRKSGKLHCGSLAQKIDFGEVYSDRRKNGSHRC
jgi:hypothetical protein